jgi:multisubunit Na+/H+ antiporter MnhG subunit
MDALIAAAVLLCLMALGVFAIPGVATSLRGYGALDGAAEAIALFLGAWLVTLAYRGLGALVEPWRLRLGRRWADTLAQLGYGIALLAGFLLTASLLPLIELGTILMAFGWLAGRGLHQAIMTQVHPDLLPEAMSTTARGELSVLLCLFGVVAFTHPTDALVAGLALILALFILSSVAANLLGRYVAACQTDAFPQRDPAQARATWRQIAPELWLALGMGIALIALLALFATPNLLDLFHRVQAQISGPPMQGGTSGTPLPGGTGNGGNGPGGGPGGSGMGTPGAYNGTGTPSGVGIYGSPAPGVTGTPSINSQTPTSGTFGNGGSTATPAATPTPTSNSTFISHDIANLLLIIFLTALAAILLLGIIHLLRRLLRRGPKPTKTLPPAATALAAEPPPPPGTIRATYRTLLQAAVDARSDLARRPAETPATYAARLRAFATTAEGQTALTAAGTPISDLDAWLETLTAEYQKIRYRGDADLPADRVAATTWLPRLRRLFQRPPERRDRRRQHSNPPPTQ